MAKMPKDDLTSTGSVSKEAANYRMGDAQGDRCETCAHYLPAQGMCDQVEGAINPGGLSDFFEPKELGQTEAPAGLEEMLFAGGPTGGPPNPITGGAL